MAENYSTTSATAAAADNHVPASDVNAAKVQSTDAKPDISIAKLEIPASGGGGAQSKISDEQFIKDVVNKTVDDVIRDASYSHDATSLWVNQIVEIVVRALVKVDRDNKYIGTSLSCLQCVIALLFVALLRKVCVLTTWGEQVMPYVHICLCVICMWYSNLYDRTKFTSGNAVRNLVLLELPDR